MTLKTFHYKCVDSTNTTALELVQRHNVTHAVVTADTQRKGRGQYNREWFSSSADGLYFTYFQPFQELVHLDSFFILSNKLLTQVSIAIKEITGCSCDCRYPNDIYLNHKKLAGILTEITQVNSIPYIFVGIGLNVNQTSFPDNLNNIATSLYLETSCHFSKAAFSLLFGDYVQRVCTSFQEDSESVLNYIC